MIGAIGATAALLAGCAGGMASDSEGPGVVIDVAALNLQGVGDVVWDLEVDNGASTPEVVWQRRLTSSGYGDGAGSASYVAPCDADPDANPNTVKVWVVGVYDAAVSSANAGTFNSTHDGVTGTAIAFQNPTTPASPLTQAIACVDNSDVAVQFDVALMRPAQQGFFDIAVNFNDIFCSAKLDCCEDANGNGCEAGEDIALLFDAGGSRARTIVLGFACTAGVADAGQTDLFMDDLALDCDGALPFDADVVIDPAGVNGNQCTAGALSTCPAITIGAGVVDTYLYQVAIFRGSEQLTSGGVDAQKAYWNIALGVTSSITSCRLRTRATADDASDANDNVVDGVIAAGTVYPYVQWDVSLDGTCASEELTFGDDTAAVRATYTGTGDAETTFDYAWSPGAPTAAPVGYGGVIYCEATRNDALGSNASHQITFTAEECGGELPAAGWVGMLGAVVSDGYGSEDNHVIDPPDAPGVGFYLRGATSNSQYVSAVYVDTNAMDAGDLITCEYPDTPAVPDAAHYIHTWTAAQCGGALPGADYSYAVGSATECGNDEDWVALSDGVRLYMRSGACAGGDWRVHYLRNTSAVMQDAIVCHRTTAISESNGAHAYTWDVSNDCGGETPTSDYVGVLFGMRRGGDDANWRALNASDTGGPGISYGIASSAGLTTDIGVLYLKMTPRTIYPRTCKAILDAGGDSGDHLYTVDLDGAGPMGAVDVYCDMTGGGYTLLTNVYDSAGDDAPNDVASAAVGWQQTGDGAWSATVSTVDRDISGAGSVAVPSSVVKGLWDDGAATVLRMCLVSTTNVESCRTSDDGAANLAITTPPAGIVNTTLAGYNSGNGCTGTGCAAAYTYGRIMGLPGSRNDYAYADFIWGDFCILRTVGVANEWGNDTRGLCEHDGSDALGWRAVWHAWGSGIGFRPWETNDNELGNGDWDGAGSANDDPNPSVNSYGFRLWVR